MKTAVFAVFSVILAAIAYLFVFAFISMTVGIPAALLIGEGPVMEFVLVYVPALLTGMILARVKPFYMPLVTAPVGTMAYWGVIAFQDAGPPWWVRVGLVASVGLVTLLGCLLATKARLPMARFRVPFPSSATTLAVLVCTSSVACVLWLVLVSDQLQSLMRPVLIVCILAQVLIALVTIGNSLLFAVRAPKSVD